MKLIAHPHYKILKDKFQIPKKDIITGLYAANYQNQFYKGYQIKTKKKIIIWILISMKIILTEVKIMIIKIIKKKVKKINEKLKIKLVKMIKRRFLEKKVITMILYSK